MQSIEQPTKEFDRIPLLLKPKLARTGAIDLLEELVRAHLALEQPRVPYFLGKGSESLKKFRLLSTKRGQEEVVSQRRDVHERVNNNIHVVIMLDIVQANIARKIRFR